MCVCLCVLTNQASSIQPNMLITVIHIMSLRSTCSSGQVAGDSKSTQDQCRYMMHSVSTFNMCCHTFVLLTVKVTWLIPPHLLRWESNQSFPPSPHLFCPPRFSQSFSSASIFSQLSSVEGMRGLFSAFSLTHYLAADSHSLLIP